MLDWLRKKSAVPERVFSPNDLAYPFAFPVIETCAGAILAHRTPATFGMIPGKFAHGSVPDMIVASADGSRWRRTAVLAICRTGKRMLGQEILWAEFAYTRLGAWEISELRREIAHTVEQGDDIWDQETVLPALRSATTFDELVAAIAGGHDG